MKPNEFSKDRVDAMKKRLAVRKAQLVYEKRDKEVLTIFRKNEVTGNT